jgi:hypothetical protein
MFDKIFIKKGKRRLVVISMSAVMSELMSMFVQKSRSVNSALNLAGLLNEPGLSPEIRQMVIRELSKPEAPGIGQRVSVLKQTIRAQAPEKGRDARDYLFAGIMGLIALGALVGILK